MELFGKSDQSSAPERGMNALKVVISTFIGIDQISQTFPEGVSTNGIITKGGNADNIIPEYAKCQFSIRAKTRKDILTVLEKVKDVIKSSEILTGARVEIFIEPVYAERSPNMIMELSYKKYLEELGEEVEIANHVGKYGSSDIGNVSLRMPIIHSYFRIMKDHINSHSKEFTQWAVAFEGMIKSAKALAMLGADPLMDKAFRDKVVEEFDRKVRQRIKNLC